MRIYILNFLLILCCVVVMLASHPPACSHGNTPLTLAIDLNKSDVVALLRRWRFNRLHANADAAVAAAADGDAM